MKITGDLYVGIYENGKLLYRVPGKMCCGKVHPIAELNRDGRCSSCQPPEEPCEECDVITDTDFLREVDGVRVCDYCLEEAAQ